jgi:hypothetical protein
MSTTLRPNLTQDQLDALFVATELLLGITVERHADGSLHTTVRFPEGPELTSSANDPDLGFDEADTVLHDVAHTLLLGRLGLRSPVLERVVDLRPLTQDAVDAEEAATFALQGFLAALRGDDATPHWANVRTALDRLQRVDA